MTEGIIFNLQRYSLHDGPGIRTTVFLKGCPARCWWCHNPESQLPTPEIATSENRCISCEACRLVCSNSLKSDACITCGTCTEACPTGAREMLGYRTSSEALLQTILKDRMFFDDSGGGVTFSGGEPLCQPKFLKDLLAGCRSHGIHSAIDTAALCSPATLCEVAPLADLFLFDLKCADPELHRAGTGSDNRTILENLELLGGIHQNIWLRIPVIPGFNDTNAEMSALAELAARAKGVRQVWLLPYHGSWAAKPARLGKETPTQALDATTPCAETMDNFARLFRAKGLDTQIGGA